MDKNYTQVLKNAVKNTVLRNVVEKGIASLYTYGGTINGKDLAVNLIYFSSELATSIIANTTVQYTLRKNLKVKDPFIKNLIVKSSGSAAAALALNVIFSYRRNNLNIISKPVIAFISTATYTIFSDYKLTFDFFNRIFPDVVPTIKKAFPFIDDITNIIVKISEKETLNPEELINDLTKLAMPDQLETDPNIPQAQPETVAYVATLIPEVTRELYDAVLSAKELTASQLAIVKDVMNENTMEEILSLANSKRLGPAFQEACIEYIAKLDPEDLERLISEGRVTEAQLEEVGISLSDEEEEQTRIL